MASRRGAGGGIMLASAGHKLEGRKAEWQEEVSRLRTGEWKITHSTKGITRRGTSTKGNTERGMMEKNTGGWWERHQSG